MIVSSYDEKALDIIKKNIKLTGQAKVIQGEEIYAAFIYANITFLAGNDEAAGFAVQEQYDYHIIDFGQADYIGDIRLQGCDRLFLIGDLSLCNYRNSLDAVYLLERRNIRNMQFMSVFYSNEGLRAYKKAAKDRPILIPVDMEPFAISRETLMFMEELLI